MPYTYWYAIIHAPQPLEGTAVLADTAPPGGVPASWGEGLRGCALRLVLAGELAAVVSDWPQATVNRSSDTVDPELVWQHEHVIERIMAGCAVLPVRFGAVLAGDERVAAVLAERQAVLLADLAHVDGCVELGLRVLWDPPPAGGAVAVTSPAGGLQDRPLTPGMQYLRRRSAEEQMREAVRRQGETLANELIRSLGSGAVDTRQSVLQTERMLLAAAFLVRRAEVNGFLAAVERLRAQYSQLAFLCSGPWPPYHFMSA